jgi:light-regulated signal transduction histidine kinase (bacteriophytochrome)
VFFELNKSQIEQMVPSSSEAATETSEMKKDIQECMREVQRVFKSIIKGSQEEIQFDQLHVIICLNKLIACE